MYILKFYLRDGDLQQIGKRSDKKLRIQQYKAEQLVKKNVSCDSQIDLYVSP